MDCCNCFELFRRKHSETEPKSVAPTFIKRLSQEHVLSFKIEDGDNARRKDLKHKSIAPIHFYRPSFVVDDTCDASNGHSTVNVQVKQAFKELKITDFPDEADRYHKCKAPVKLTYRAVRSEDFDGNKMVNEYVRECLIGTGSYGKVVLHRSKVDGKFYAIKIFRKSRLRKVRVAPSQMAMSDVLQEERSIKERE